MAGYPVVPPSEADASLAPGVLFDISTTRQKFSFAGAKWLSISYRALPGSAAVTNQYAKVVINASSDADADGKLALDGGYIPLCQGDDLLISGSSTIKRLDVLTALAVGAEKTLFRVLAGV